MNPNHQNWTLARCLVGKLWYCISFVRPTIFRARNGRRRSGGRFVCWRRRSNSAPLRLLKWTFIYMTSKQIERGVGVKKHPKFAQTEVILLKVLDFFMVAFDPRTQPRTKCLEAPRSWLRSIMVFVLGCVRSIILVNAKVNRGPSK